MSELPKIPVLPSDGSSPTTAVAGEALTPEAEARRVPVGAVVAGVIVGLIVVVGLLLAVIYMASNPEPTRTIRDIAIVLLALSSFLVVVALVILIALVSRLVLLLQHEIKPLLETTADTLNTVRGTAVFMSSNVVSPMVKTASYVEGARRFLEALVGLRPRKPRP